MSLFPTAPANDPADAQAILATAQAHDYVFRGQLPSSQYVIGEYVSNITPSDAAGYNQRLVVKHDEKKVTKRRVLQTLADFPINDGTTLKGITVNVSLVHHDEHTTAQITEVLEQARDLIGNTGFAANFHLGLV